MPGWRWVWKDAEAYRGVTGARALGRFNVRKQQSVGGDERPSSVLPTKKAALGIGVGGSRAAAVGRVKGFPSAANCLQVSAHEAAPSVELVALDVDRFRRLGVSVPDGAGSGAVDDHPAHR